MIIGKSFIKHKKRTLFYAYHAMPQREPAPLLRHFTTEAKPLQDVTLQTSYKWQYLAFLRQRAGYHRSLIQEQPRPSAEEGSNSFDSMLQTKQDEIMLESLKQIDRKKFILNLLKSTSLSKLSSEILKVSLLARGLSQGDAPRQRKKHEQVVNFLVSLDFLVKGLLSHWQIRLSEGSTSTKGREIMKGLDVKFPILIGDQYHTIAYYMVSRLGNLELTRILTVIEENFQKIFFSVEAFGVSFEHNLKLLYKQFYNYLPTFFAHGFK